MAEVVCSDLKVIQTLGDLTLTATVYVDTLNGREVDELIINWGDGSNKEVLDGDQAQIALSHKYREAGIFAINAIVTSTSSTGIKESFPA